MILRIVLVVLVLNFIAAPFIVLSNHSRQDKIVWISVLWALPLALWAAYRIFCGRQKKFGDFKEWESR